MLNGIIFITTFQMRWNEIFELLQNNSIQRIKTYILLQKLDILKQYAIMRQNGTGQTETLSRRPDCRIIRLVWMDLA